jgi:hypothetical protein
MKLIKVESCSCCPYRRDWTWPTHQIDRRCTNRPEGYRVINSDDLPEGTDFPKWCPLSNV